MVGASSIKGLVKKLVLGEALAQQSTVAIREPQNEIAVWLRGVGTSRDVTQLHSIACASPFTVCISFSNMESIKNECDGNKVSLELRERGGAQRLLGKIGLRFNTAIQMGQISLGLFHASSCASYCLPRVRFWAHYLQQAYWRWRDKKVPNVRMSLIDGHAMMSMFICPRPVVLVTTMEGQRGNMFPMNLMGQLGCGYFSFALNSERQASQCVKRAGRVALSSIPFEAADAARQLGKHHKMASIDWKDLPFPVKDWKSFGGPIPEFALRAREVEVEAVKELGSHTFFIGRTLREEHYSDREYFYMVHGMYQAWRAANAQRGLP